MPTTSNFGWNTPADTDLVKDGAAAIRTLGNNIDASLVDLKGGTTGQVLAKASNTDLDFTWTNGGDITEVAAGTGLTGGGTTGAVTISLATPVTATNGGTAQTTYATGDLLFASAANTLSKRTIGTTGQVLAVSGGVPVWSTLSTGGETVIATGSLTGSSIDIQNIPSSYNSLILILNQFSLSSNGRVAIRLNDMSSTSYTSVRVQGNNNGAAVSAVADQTNWEVTQFNTSANNSNQTIAITIPTYTDNNLIATSLAGYRNSASNLWQIEQQMLQLHSVSPALNSIQILATNSGAFTFDNGTYTLYGVK